MVRIRACAYLYTYISFFGTVIVFVVVVVVVVVVTAVLRFCCALLGLRPLASGHILTTETQYTVLCIPAATND